MEIPQYWIKAEAEELARTGEKVRGVCWGWSDSSDAEARSRAEERAQEVARKLAAGEELSTWYGYNNRPIREERVREEKFGVLTRSGYGSLILNCPDTMFIDVDSEGSPAGLGSFLKGLFGKPAVVESYPEVEKLREFQSSNPEWSFRVYKTHSGFRYIVVNGKQDPESDTVARVMDAVGADPLYMKLCRVQKCFRARVSPKPWRCESSSPSVRFPFASSDEKSQFEVWKKEYEELEVKYASAKFLETIGRNSDPSLQPLVKLHDSLCRTRSELPLA